MQRRKISMNITFHDEGHSGIPTTAKMRQMENELPALRPLVLFLKLFLLTVMLTATNPVGLGLTPSV